MSSDEDLPPLSEDGESDWDEIEECMQLKCLFCEETLNDSESAVKHLRNQHNFDLIHLRLKHSMDCYSYIKMINYIQKLRPKPEEILASHEVLWDVEEYLRPTINDDPWIMLDFEGLNENKSKLNKESGDHILNNTTMEISVQQYEEMKKAIIQLKQEINEKQEYIKMAAEDMNKMKIATQNIIENISSNQENKAQGVNTVASLDAGHDEGYFNSYAHFDIHYEMLTDKVRTESYRNAILQNKALFDNRIVLDVGCGTSILSMFSAKAGAKQVIGIDMSDIIYQAMDIVRENDLHQTVTLIKGRLEDIELPVDKVDIIVSEWMGYFLLFEGMLDSVIYARDKYLKSGGLLLPNRCNISLVGSGDSDDHKNYINFWTDVYGFKMSCMKSTVLKETNLDVVRKEHLITDPYVIADINLMTCDTDCVNFSSEFTLKAKKDGYLASLVGYFDTFFELPNPVAFSTGPYSDPTHWKQTVFYLKEPIMVKEGQTITGLFVCKRDTKNVRGLQILLKIFDQTYKYIL